MNSTEFFEWMTQKATPEERKLWERMNNLTEHFGDMTFSEGTPTYDLVSVTIQTLDGEDEYEDAMPIPDEIRYFGFEIPVEICDLPDGVLASFNPEEWKFTISLDHTEDDSVLVHELIHMFESLINKQPLYWHDMVLWSLYDNLRNKVKGLDEIIRSQSHILTGSTMYQSGELHDLLFLLKSIDLDVRLHYPLGTVYGYGLSEELKQFSQEEG